MNAILLTRVIHLLLATSQLPDVDPARATGATIAALAVETDEFPAELLLAIAWGESRFINETRTGRACGAMQTIARAGDCERWRDPIEGFRAGVDELREWSRDHRTRGDLRLILGAYACGNSIFNGTCTKTRWPGWVLARARKLGMHDVRPST